MNKALWTIQTILACIFLFAAGLKFFHFDAMAAATPGTAQLKGRFIAIGCCEVAGALGLILPGATGIWPSLTIWAAVGLATIAFLAGIFHIARDEYSELPGAVLLFALAAFVVWGRTARR